MSSPETEFWSDSVVEWAATSLVDVADPSAWVREMAERIRAGGVPITRMRIMFRILHPQLAGLNFRWRHGADEIEFGNALQGIETRDAYRNSPAPLLESGEVTEVWRSLERPAADLEYPVLHELQDEGMTDYLLLRITMSVGRGGLVSFATDRPGGFGKREVERLRQIMRAATRGVEILVRHETVLSLLRAYLGHETGTRVLAGSVQRGDGQSQQAVIWFSDLRQSTRLSEHLSPPDYLALLNDYFDCLAQPVLDNDGEVLRFIGDAVLAIFPVGDETDAAWKAACAQALAAACAAGERVDTLNADRADRDLEPIGYGIGLHLGAVHYGNIGTEERVEFTVVGRAANTAAKIEAMCKPLQQRLVVSEEVARYHDGPWDSLGHHHVPGTELASELFTLAGQAASRT